MIDYGDIFEQYVNQARASGDQIYGLCPFHEDKSPSFSANTETGLWNCKGCDAKGNFEQFCEAVGLVKEQQRQQMRPAIIKRYVYEDEKGNRLYRISRTEPKGFFAERYQDGRWLTGMNGTQHVLYRLPVLVEAACRHETVWIVEGEADADTLGGLGLLATTNPFGAGKWRAEYSGVLRGRQVIILPDNDEAGRKHAAMVAGALTAR